MRARKAKPRPGRERNAGDKVSAHKRTFPQEHILVFPRLGAVLPQPGFLIHLPGGEKSGLGGVIGMQLKTNVRLVREATPMTFAERRDLEAPMG